MADNDLTSEGTRLVKEWLATQSRIDTAKRELNRAESDMLNSQRALAKWLMPNDAKPGEKISVWHGDSLIQVEVPLQEHMTPPVTVRKRGRSISRAA